MSTLPIPYLYLFSKTYHLSLAIPLLSPKYRFAEPRVHALVYDPLNGGVLSRLEVDFKPLNDDLDGIYGLYSPPAALVQALAEPTVDGAAANATVTDAIADSLLESSEDFDAAE